MEARLVIHRDQHSTVFSAVVGDKAVARLELGVYPPTGLVVLLHVDGKYRRKGLGTALLVTAERWAGDHGLRWLELRCRKGNTPAEKMYHKVGFAMESDPDCPDLWWLCAKDLRNEPETPAGIRCQGEEQNNREVIQCGWRLGE